MTRCPNGSRKNKTTGECERKKSNFRKWDQNDEERAYYENYKKTHNNESPPDEEEDTNIIRKRVKKRCPNGSKKNKTTGKCERKKNTTTSKKRCPNGSRKNKTTGECDRKKSNFRKWDQNDDERAYYENYKKTHNNESPPSPI